MGRGAGTMTQIAFGSRPGRWLLAVTVLGSGMAFLDGTVVNVALPTIGRDLHASTGSLQWVLSGYLLALASLILLGGTLGDRHGRRKVFTIGVAVFTGASLLCAIAPTVQMLIAARMLQGIGGALLTPGSLAMIEASFRPDDRARAIGAWSGLTGVASALGPLLGGYLVAAVSWRAVFLINLPIGLCVAVAARQVPETRDRRSARLDVKGATASALALAGSTYALIEGPNEGPTAPVLAATVAAVLAAAALAAIERGSESPMLPPRIFSRQFSSANAVTFVVYTALGGVFFLFVAFLQVALGYSPLAAGASSLPITLLMLLFSPRSASLARRIGPRIPLAAGSLTIAIGMLLMTQIGKGDGYLVGVLPAVIVFGAGLTLVVSPVTAAVLAAADERDAGIASGINNAVARVAGLLAVALLPAIAGLSGKRFYDPVAMTDGFHVAMIVCAGIAIAGAAIAWTTIDDDLLAQGDAEPEPTFACPVTAPSAVALADGHAASVLHSDQTRIG